MNDSVTTTALLERIERLEERVDALERSGSVRRPRSSASATGARDWSDAAWVAPYSVADLHISETWIEIHEHSARPQLQRLIREAVTAEGPITEKLLVERIRVAWGLSRAGGRVQEAIAQAIRQLVARALIEQLGDAYVVPGVTDFSTVRVPSDDPATKRSADHVPLVELAAGMRRIVEEDGAAAAEDVTLAVAKLLGWTRRGGAIQERFEAAIAYGVRCGDIVETGGQLAIPAEVNA